MSSGVPRDPPFTLTELRYALAVAKHRHFGRAAQSCCVSQPTLAAGMKRLEDGLGVALFERTSKRVVVTERGAELIARASAVFERVEALVEHARGALPALAGRLSLGIIPTLSPYLLRWLLPPLRAAHPSLELVVHDGVTQEILAQLRDHRLDAIALALPIDETGLVVRPILDGPFLLLAPHAHALARAPRATQAALAEHEVLLLTDGHCLREQALEVCHGEAVRRRPAEGDFRATSLETLRQMVIADMGVTHMPAIAVSDEDRRRETTRAVRFAPPAPSRRIAIAYRRGPPRARGIDELAACARQHAPASTRAVRGPLTRVGDVPAARTVRAVARTEDDDTAHA
jgi:LysR family hydrogen peroxide-inducible transcriptional activator